MSIVDNLDPDGKEITVGGKKIDKDTTIVFNMKAFVSLLSIIVTLFGASFYYLISKIDSLEESSKNGTQVLVEEINKIKDERITDLKEKVDATDGKMELLMMLINSNQVDVTPSTQPSTQPHSVDPDVNVPNLSDM